MRYPFLILDLNGTLIDTFGDLTEALGVLLTAHARPGVDIDQVRDWSGEGLRALLRAAFLATGPTPTDLELNDLLHEFRILYERHLGAGAFLYPGVQQTLATLAGGGVRMSILTNKPQGPSLKLLEQFRIGHYFDYMVAGDTDVPRKPDPAGLLQLVTQMEGWPAGTLMVGSSRIDLETARNAGVACAIIEHGGSALHARGMGADFVLDQFSMLAALVLSSRQSGMFPM